MPTEVRAPPAVQASRARARTLSANGKSVATPCAVLPTYRGQVPLIPRQLLPDVPGGVLAFSVPASDFAMLNAKTGLCGGALAEMHPGGSLEALAFLPPSLTILTLRAPNAPPPTAHARDSTVRVDARAARLPLKAADLAMLHKRMRTDFAEVPSGSCNSPAPFASARAAEMAAAANAGSLFGAACADAPGYRGAAGALATMGFGGVSVAGLFTGESPRQRRDIIQMVSEGAGAKTVAVLGGDGDPGDVLRSVSAGADLVECRFPFEKAEIGEAIDFERGVTVMVRDKRYVRDGGPLVDGCKCMVCAGYSRAYLHHLLDVHEMLAPTLLAVHNLHSYLLWFSRIRESIRLGTDQFREFSDVFFERRAKLRSGGITRGLMPL